MKKYILTSIIALIMLSLTTSCFDDKNKVENEATGTQSFEMIDASDELVFNFTEPIYFFTLSDNGEVYATSEKIMLGKYDKNGTLIQEFKNAESLCNIYYYKEKIYAYDESINKIIEYDIKAETKIAVSDEFDFKIYEIKDLLVKDDSVYILLMPMLNYDEVDDKYEIHNQFTEPDENGYVNFGEKLYSVDLKTGRLVDENVENIMLIYKDTNEKLYYYCYEDMNYALYSIDNKSKKRNKIAGMNDVKYIFSFIYENNNFTYINNAASIYNKRMSDNDIVMLDDHILSGSGSDVCFYAGNVVYRILSTYREIEKASIASVYIGYIYGTDIKSDVNTRARALTISGSPYYPRLNTKYIKQETQLSANYVDPLFPDVYLTEIMAGNSDVDIYILGLSSYVFQQLKNMGYYVSLNESNSINAYVNGCFDYISEKVKKDNDILAFPINASSAAIFYIPENIERFDITYENFKDYYSYVDLLQRLHNDKIAGKLENYIYYAESVHIFYYLCSLYYDIEFNDLKNKMINYRTDMFKDIIKTAWDGWDYTDELHGNPLFEVAIIDNIVYDDYVYYPEFDTENLLFHYKIISDFLSPIKSIYDEYDFQFEKWRIYPFPKMTDNFNKNSISVDSALINPYSNNKEEALEYLDVIAKDPFKATNEIIFTQKDKEFYKEFIDINLPVFNDAYDIIENGYIGVGYIPLYEDDFIIDYQQGRITLEEAVERKQRNVEIALNE